MEQGNIIPVALRQYEDPDNPKLLVSELTCDIAVAGETYLGEKILIRQVLGSDYLTAPVEITIPLEHKSPVEREVLKLLVEQCYRELLDARTDDNGAADSEPEGHPPHHDKPDQYTN